MYNPRKYLDAVKGIAGAHPLARWSTTPGTREVYLYKCKTRLSTHQCTQQILVINYRLHLYVIFQGK
jgi:hypothetical protein